jgi:hypothetical protein
MAEDSEAKEPAEPSGLAATLDRTFGISAAGTSVPTELRAGLATFLTMAYIIRHGSWRGVRGDLSRCGSLHRHHGALFAGRINEINAASATITGALLLSWSSPDAGWESNGRASFSSLAVPSSLSACREYGASPQLRFYRRASRIRAPFGLQSIGLCRRAP